MTTTARAGSGDAAVRSVAHSSATVAAWTLVSRVTGLLRVVAIGAVLGPTFLANTFLATNTVPNLTFAAVAGPVLGLVLVPSVVSILLRHGTAAGRLHVRRLSGLLVTAATAVAGLLILASPALAWVLTLGVPEPERGRAWLVALALLVLVGPQVVLYTVAAVGAAAQQARQRYALAAAASALENVGLMVTMAVVAVAFDRPGDGASVPLVLLLGVGATSSVALHAAVQAFGAARAGLSIRPARDWRSDPEVRRIAARLRGSVVVTVLPAAAYFALLAVAATVPGGVVVLTMAHTVYTVSTHVGARAVTTAVLPGMSAAVTAGDRAAYAAAWRQALTYAVTAALPVLCLLVAFSRTVAGALALGELRDDALIATLTACIAILAVSQLAAAVHEVGREARFVDLDVRGPQLAGWAAFTVTVAGGVLTLLLRPGLPRLAGVCLVVLVADLVAAAVVVRLVRRVVRPDPVADLRRLAVLGLAAAAMLPALIAGRVLIPGDGPPLRDAALLSPFALLAIGAFVATLSSLTGRSRTAA
jgi:peptidoglycan biosynthesis protein MviN/MurJ (putative lipid II flippase)